MDKGYVTLQFAGATTGAAKLPDDRKALDKLLHDIGWLPAGEHLDERARQTTRPNNRSQVAARASRGSTPVAKARRAARGKGRQA